MIVTALMDPCPECKSDEAKIDEDRCFESWVEGGHRPEQFDVLQCEHISCVRCGLQLT